MTTSKALPLLPAVRVKEQHLSTGVFLDIHHDKGMLSLLRHPGRTTVESIQMHQEDARHTAARALARLALLEDAIKSIHSA